MVGRRLVALALVTTLLPLNVLRADGTCTHREPVATPPVAQHDAHPVLPHHDVVETSPEAGAHAATGMPCDSPTPSDCCQALASCASGMEIAGETAIAVLTSSHDAAIAVFSAMPVSRVTTPDPPPPRA